MYWLSLLWYCHTDIAKIGKQGKPELLESVIDPGLGEGFAQTSELIADCKGQLTSQVTRIRELRAKKEENPRK